MPGCIGFSDLEGQVKVPATLNPAGMDLEDWRAENLS
jgi:predicted aconitase